MVSWDFAITGEINKNGIKYFCNIFKITIFKMPIIKRA
jgi:hypothetical protein